MRFDADQWLIETYESVFDSEAFIEQFRTLAASHGSPFCALHVEGEGRTLDLGVGFDLEQVAPAYPEFRNLWLERGAERLMAEGITHDGFHTSVREMRRTEYHRHLLRPLDIDHSIGVLCDRLPGGGFTMLSLSRSARAGEYDDSDVRRLLALRPHLRTLTRLHARAAERERRAASLEALLDRSRTPRMWLDGRLRVRAANRAAEALLDDGDLARLGPDDAFCLAEAGPARRFAAAMARCGSLELVIVARASGRRALLQAEPLEPSLGGESGGYLVTLAPLHRSLAAPVDRLAGLFDFTPREAAIAQALARHFRLRAAAEAVDMRYETARTHLKHCFEKTGTSSQAELVALVRDALSALG